MIALAVVSLVSKSKPPLGMIHFMNEIWHMNNSLSFVPDKQDLWIVANSILVFLGSMGLISCLILAIGTTMPIHEKQNSEVCMYFLRF